MPFLPLRPVPVAAPAASLYNAWLSELEEELLRPDCDRAELCRRILTRIYYPGLEDVDPASLNGTGAVALAQMDPRNVTLEPEYYQDIDVRLSFGYNMEVGDDVVVHRHVLLDDRGGIEIGDGASISDFANVYSHTHDIVDGRIVHTPRTVIGAGVRITYHATILAGTTVANDSMVGAGSILTRDTRPHWVHVGIPARPVKEKPAEERAAKAPPTPDPLADPA